MGQNTGVFGPHIWFPDLHHIHENSVEILAINNALSINIKI